MGRAVEVCPVCHPGNNDEDASSIAEIRQVGGNEVIDPNIRNGREPCVRFWGNLTCLQTKETRF